MRTVILALAVGALAFGAPPASPLRADDAVVDNLDPAASDTALGTGHWQVVPAPTDGTSFPAASILSDDGYRLYVWSRSDERGQQVFAEIHAPDDARFIGRMPVYRIDGEPPVDTEEIRAAGDEQGLLWGFTVERVALWMLWLGDNEVPENDPLHDWFDGERLEVSIRMANGVDRTVAFTLAGARGAIERASSVRPEDARSGI